MIPHQKELFARLGKAKFAMIGIMSEKDRGVAKKFLEREGVAWRQVWDDGPIAATWAVGGKPTNLVLDANGVIRFRDVSGLALNRAVDELLKELPET